MGTGAIEPLVWDTIEQNIRGGHCVPFLGAGVNVGAGLDGLPLGGEVASRLAAKFAGQDDLLENLIRVDQAVDELLTALMELVAAEQREGLKANYRDLFRLRAYDLARVALHAESKVGKPSLVQWLQQILPDEQREPSRVLRTIAALPVRLVVTTNYDRLMERAYELEGQPEPLVVCQPLAGFDGREQRAWERQLSQLIPEQMTPREPGERPIIYKIHGSFGPGGGGLVVSEDDYIEFLNVMSPTSRRGMPPLIGGLLTGSSLLFLGFGLEDWDFRTIHKALIERQERDEQWRSFALQKWPTPFWQQVWSKRGVEIYDCDLRDFAEELRQRFGMPQ